MNETIGVKGGHNDRRRMIIRKSQRKKLEEVASNKEVINLEKKLKKSQIINFIQFLPVVIVGQTVQTLSNNSKSTKTNSIHLPHQAKLFDKRVVSSQKEQDRSILGSLKNGNLVFKKDIEIFNLPSKGNADNIEKKKDQRDINPTKEMLQNTISIPNLFSQKKSPVSSQKKSPVSSQKKSSMSSQKEFFVPFQKESTGIDITLDSELFEKLKGRKIVDVYEKKLKDLRYDLRKIIFEYNVLVQEKDEVLFSKK